MASQIDNSTFTFNQEELKDFAEVIHELIYSNSDLNRIHDVNEGVKYDQQIVFAGKIGLMGKAVTGCTPNEIDGVTLTEKTWSPVNEDFRLTHCNAEVDSQDKLVQQMSKMNPDYYNVIEGSSSVVGNFLVAKVIEGFQENLLRKVWFSDTAADTIAGGGELTNGTDVDYFNTFNGLFKQIFTEVTGSNFVAISANAGVTYAAQALGTGDSIAILKAMYSAADSRLIGSDSPDKMFLVTRTIWDGYLCDLEDIQNSGAGNTMINENGQMQLFYRGIELINMEVWDRNINSYYNDGTVWDKPHRAVLTVPRNIPIATLAQSDFGDLDAFYDRKEKKNYIDGVYSIDAKHLEGYLTVAAY